MTESESVALPLGDAAIFGTVYIIAPIFEFVNREMKKIINFLLFIFRLEIKYLVRQSGCIIYCNDFIGKVFVLMWCSDETIFAGAIWEVLHRGDERKKEQTTWGGLFFFWRALEDFEPVLARLYSKSDNRFSASTVKSQGDLRGPASWRRTKKRTDHARWSVLFLARPRGFEPLAYRFVAGHSIRWAKGALKVLAYSTTKKILCQ